MWRNICTKFELETPSSKFDIPLKVLESDRAKILVDFQMQTDKKVMAHHLNIVVMDEKAVVIDGSIPMTTTFGRRNRSN